MTHINGEHDADLHHQDGTHRDEPPPVRERYSGHRALGDVIRGSALESREAGWGAWRKRLDAHRARHEQERASEMTAPVTINGVTRPSDEDLHLVIMGSFGLSYGWWRLDSPREAETDERGEPVKGWYVDVSLFDDDELRGHGRLTADLLWSTVVAISTGLVPHVGTDVVRECRRLVYVGADQVDFDQATSDEVLQTAIIGSAEFT